jgi:hypothetical protein
MSNSTPEPTEDNQPFDFDRTVGMLSVAVLGTAVAGGAFPVVLIVAEILASEYGPLRGPLAEALGMAAATVILGGMVGFMVALAIGFTMSIVAAAIAWLCSLPAGTVWFESLVGGWSGFFSVHMLLDSVYPNPWLCLGLAVLTGQLGAGGAVWLVKRRRQPIAEREASESHSKIGIRQLFGLTTAIAILAAIGSTIDVDSVVYSTLWLAVAIQAGVIALWFFWCARWRRPGAR